MLRSPPLKVITADVKTLLAKASVSASSATAPVESLVTERVDIIGRKIASMVDQAVATDCFSEPADIVRAAPAHPDICDLPVCEAEAVTRKFVTNDASLKIHEVWVEGAYVSVARAYRLEVQIVPAHIFAYSSRCRMVQHVRQMLAR